MRTTVIALLAASLLTACGGADKEEIFRAREFVRKLCELESGDNGAFDGMTLYKASTAFDPVPAGTMVAVSPEGIAVDGKLVTTTDQVLAEPKTSGHLYGVLAEQRMLERAIAARDPGRQEKPLVVAFSSGVSAKVVHVVTQTLLQSEYRHVLLAFEPGIAPQVPPAPDRPLDDELRRLPEDQLPLYGANKMAELAADCPDLAELFNALAFVPPEQRCSMIANSLGEVFGSSSCRTDIDKVLTVVQAMTVPRKPRTVHPVVLHNDSPGIPAKPTDTWAQIAEALFKRGNDRLWLELAPEAPAAAEQQPPTEQ